jgi:hypothetical protein
MARKEATTLEAETPLTVEPIHVELNVELGELVGFSVVSKGNKKTGGTWIQATLKVNPTSAELIKVVERVAQQEKLVVTLHTLQPKLM